MVIFQRGLAATSLLILFCFSEGPATAAHGAWLGFRNDSDLPIIVQVGTAIRPGRSQLLYPGEVAWSCVLQPGTRQILIRQALPPQRTFLQETITCGSEDLFFSVRNSSSSTRLVAAPAPGR